jgi:hypothetical protein
VEVCSDDHLAQRSLHVSSVTASCLPVQITKRSIKILTNPVTLFTNIAVLGKTAKSCNLSLIFEMRSGLTKIANVVAAIATPRSFQVVLSSPAARSTYEEKVMAFEADTWRKTQSIISDDLSAKLTKGVNASSGQPRRVCPLKIVLQSSGSRDPGSQL